MTRRRTDAREPLRSVFLRDQIAGAVAEAHDVVAAAPFLRPDAGFKREVRSPWAERFLERFARDSQAGRVAYCSHLMSTSQPMPVLVTGHEPRRARCIRCAGQALSRVEGTVEDRTCDGCRTVVHDGLYAALGAYGAILISYGLCGPCRDVDRGQVVRDRRVTA